MLPPVPAPPLPPEPVVVPLELHDCSGDGPPARLVDLLETAETEVDARGRVELELPGYGYRWLRVVHETERRLI